jgi:pimeloyl-ACP methyl ester carboxylesterase
VKLLSLCLLSAAAWAAPCITVAGCTEWVTFAGGPARSMIYRTYPLDVLNPQIARALIVIHGTGRDADNYFRTALAAAFLGGALDDTIVIAPRVASSTGSCHDQLATNEVSWSCAGDSWRSGGAATNHEKLTSFDFTDEILRKLARKETFPNLRAIVVSGHSAGGQYVERYAMANTVHEEVGVPVTYVVSNPSSYAYLDNTRPHAEGSDFRAFTDGRNCTTYNQWPYGLEHRTGGYTARETDDQLKKQLAGRPVTYLLGEIDILPLGGFDGSCPAMAQGPTRLARGQAFSKYVNQKFGARHSVTVVPLCGHNARCMFTAEPALPILFPKDVR